LDTRTVLPTDSTTFGAPRVFPVATLASCAGQFISISLDIKNLEMDPYLKLFQNENSHPESDQNVY
jgi:hypothetical protein